METIEDILSTMNKLYFKTSLTKEEFDYFKDIRKILLDEFSDYYFDKKDLCDLLDLVDQMHIKFLRDKILSHEDIITEFRQITFKLIDQKAKIENEDN